MPQKNVLRGSILVSLSSIFYASYGVWGTLISTTMSGYILTSVRSLLVVILLLPVVVYKNKKEKLQIKKYWRQLLLIFLTLFFVWGPLQYAIVHIGVGLGTAVNYSTIVIMLVVFGVIFSGEKLTSIKLTSVTLGIGGMTIAFLPNAEHFGGVAIAAGVVSGIASAIYIITVKNLPYSTELTSLVNWCLSLLANTVASLVLRHSFDLQFTNTQWVYLLLYSLCSVLASWTFVAGVRKVDTGLAGILGLLEIAFGVLFGIVLFAEKLTLLSFFGVSLVLVAAALPYTQNKASKT